MPAFAPVPDFARGPEIPEAGYRVTELGGGAYGISSGMVNTMFLVTSNGVVVVDAPPDLDANLLAGIEETTPKPITSSPRGSSRRQTTTTDLCRPRPSAARGTS